MHLLQLTHKGRPIYIPTREIVLIEEIDPTQTAIVTRDGMRYHTNDRQRVLNALAEEKSQ